MRIIRAWLARRRRRRDVAGARRLLAEYGIPADGAALDLILSALATHFRGGGTIRAVRSYATDRAITYLDEPPAGRVTVEFVAPPADHLLPY